MPGGRGSGPGAGARGPGPRDWGPGPGLGARPGAGARGPGPRAPRSCVIATSYGMPASDCDKLMATLKVTTLGARQVLRVGVQVLP